MRLTTVNSCAKISLNIVRYKLLSEEQYERVIEQLQKVRHALIASIERDIAKKDAFYKNIKKYYTMPTFISKTITSFAITKKAEMLVYLNKNNKVFFGI